MWKRHRALNALAGHNISTVHMDHMGVPRLQGVPAAARHRGEVCHLVNERGGTEKRGEVHQRDCGVSLCCTPEVERARRRRTARPRRTK